ncbi:PDZ domain-containing protein [Thermodesulfovibrio hydrogeniphilus]
MLRNKSHTKNLIFFFVSVFILLFAHSSNAQEDVSKLLKDKIDLIQQKYFNSIVSFPKAVAVAIDKNIALIPASALDEQKNLSIIALDSKLNIAVVKLPTEQTPVNFKATDKFEEVYFLLTIFEQPIIILIKGTQRDNKIEIDGHYPLGSLLLSFDLSPVGIIVKNEPFSEALVISSVYPEINKMIYRKPGWMGLQAQTINEELSKIFNVSEGVVITNIYEGGPSDKAGLQRGDVITEANGHKIKDLKDLQNLLSTKFAGETLMLKIIRDGSQKIVNVILEEPPESLSSTKNQAIQGIKGVNIAEIPDSLRKNIPKSIKGVLVSKIEELSPALGILKEGDIIVEINKKPINNTKDFNETVAQSTNRDLLILVYRQDSFQYVIIPAQKSR